jgi:hypothetical protein
MGGRFRAPGGCRGRCRRAGPRGYEGLHACGRRWRDELCRLGGMCAYRDLRTCHGLCTLCAALAPPSRRKSSGRVSTRLSARPPRVVSHQTDGRPVRPARARRRVTRRAGRRPWLLPADDPLRPRPAHCDVTHTSLPGSCSTRTNPPQNNPNPTPPVPRPARPAPTNQPGPTRSAPPTGSRRLDRYGFRGALPGRRGTEDGELVSGDLARLGLARAGLSGERRPVWRRGRGS